MLLFTGVWVCVCMCLEEPNKMVAGVQDVIMHGMDKEELSSMADQRKLQHGQWWWTEVQDGGLLQVF